MKKYLFETFDAEPAPASTGEVPEATVYSEDELAAAQRESFAQGRAEGCESALQSIEQTTAQALSAIAAQLEAAAVELAAVNERREHQSLQAAIAILRKLFPELARRHGLDEIEAAIAVCLERLHDEPRVVIHSADTLVDRLRDGIEPLAEACGFEGKLVLLADKALSSSDVRIEWADGGAERDTGRLWDEVDQILADSLGRLSAETDLATEQTPPQRAAAKDNAAAEAVVEDPIAEHNTAAAAETVAPTTEDTVVAEIVT